MILAHLIRRSATNGIAEREIRNVLEGTRTLLEHSRLPTSYWPYASRCFCHHANIRMVDQFRFLSHLRMLCFYIASHYAAFPKSHARCPACSEDLCIFLPHLRMTCLYTTSYYSAFPTFRAGRPAFSEDLYRFLSHLRMPCFNFISYYSLIAVSYRSVHEIRVSTRKILALRGLCAYRVFDPRFVSCWPMFADLSVVRRRSARCLLKLRSRLRQTRNRNVYLLFCETLFPLQRR